MSKPFIFSVLGTVIVLFITTLGCMKYLNADERTTEPADFTGFITRISMAPEGFDGDTVFAESHAEKLVRKCVIELTSETLIFKKDGDAFQPISPGQLLVQDQVQVWFKRKYMPANPYQGKAKQIVVINHY